MIELYPIQDREVSRKLMARATSAQGLVLVSGARHGKHMRPVQEREPYASLESRFGKWVTQLVVVEEESKQVAWRDPLGDLAEHFFPTDKPQGYAAVAGYLLIRSGMAEDVIKKRSADEDIWYLQEALAAAHREIPRPPPQPVKGKKKATPGQRPEADGADAPLADAPAEDTPRRPRARATGHRQPPRHEPVTPPPFESPAVEPTPISEPTPVPPAPPPPTVEVDPWLLLGVPRGTPLLEVRKAFRVLMAQYHPDKVAHLAPEFRELADRKSRDISAAFEKIQAELGGGSPSS